jgi:hypothetical protein
MTSVEEIKRAITQLSPEAARQLRRWYEQFDAKQWDRQIASDVAAGRLDELAEEALQAFRAQATTEL